MSTFKTYAKQAKQRLKNDFWSQVKSERALYLNSCQNDGISRDGLMVKQKQVLKDKIYNSNYESDEQFYERVKAILTQDAVVVNPIGMLADKSLTEEMTESQKQAYLFKLSARYRQAVEKFNKEKSSL